jgi:hypothetical protein
VGAQHARAQDATDTSSQVSESQPPTDGQPPATDAPAAEASGSPVEASSEPPADTTSYDASADGSVATDDASASETAAAQADAKWLKLLWGVQLGYLFPTDTHSDFRAAKWMPIGAELDLGMGKSPFAIVFKADVSPLCFGGHDCSGTQVRALAGLEVGIQKGNGSVLHMVYLNASLGYRYASSSVENAAGDTTNGKISGLSLLMSEVSACMMIPVTHNFSLGPRVALSSNLTSNTKEGVSSLQLGVRFLHAPGR